MAQREVSDAAAAVLLSEYLSKHLAAGTGNDGKPQTAASFASRAKISESRLSEWRHRIGSLPNLSTLQVLERAFFPTTPHRNDPARIEWEEVKHAILTHGTPRQPTPDDKRFSSRETWDLLMRPLAGRVTPIVRSAAGGAATALRPEQIAGRVLDRAFILPMPEWFTDGIGSDPLLAAGYDLHAPTDLSGDPDCAAFYAAVPIENLRVIVAYHADAYARQVLDELRARPAYPPYNKKKLGLFGYQQAQRSGAAEGVYLDLDFYVTNYHTHRVMRRVLHDVRGARPALFGDEADPDNGYLRYFTTSFGVNVVATTQERHGKRFYLARLSRRQGNANQQGLWHVTANEGLNLDDVHGDGVDMVQAVDRALCEEFGSTCDDPAAETIFLEFAVDRRNLEPFLSCLTHLAIDRETLYRRKQHLARDDRREFSEVLDVAFTETGIIQLLLDEPAGVEGFTSYGLNILDSILMRDLAPSV